MMLAVSRLPIYFHMTYVKSTYQLLYYNNFGYITRRICYKTMRYDD